MYNNTDCNPSIINCTFVSNSAGGRAGGVFNRQGSSPIFQNVIFWENTDSENSLDFAHIQGGDFKINNCCIYKWLDRAVEDNILNRDPLFVDLQSKQANRRRDDRAVQPAEASRDTGNRRDRSGRG